MVNPTENCVTQWIKSYTVNQNAGMMFYKKIKEENNN